jgi:D-3-phosphoglycerate dehydrogenase
MAALRPRLLLAETEGFTPQVLATLRGWAEVEPGPLPSGGISGALRDFDIVWIRLGHRVRAADIPADCRCRIIALPATGLDHLDLEACGRANIRIAALKGEVEFLRSVRATAEHTVALALGLIRRLPAAHASVLDGRWDRDAFRGRELYGRVAGIIGMGRLGSIVAGYLRAFGMEIIGYDSRPDFPTELARRCESLEELFAAADVISVHLAYDVSTRHLITARHFSRARPGAVLVNTSRGGVIDAAALLAALEQGTLAGAALDVIDGEPEVGRDHPLVAYARAHDNLVITPHVAGNTSDSLAKAEGFIAAKARRMWEELDRG